MIINSLLDTDFYKLTMCQAVYHHFPNVEVEYTFKCRNKDIKFDGNFCYRLTEELRHLSTLRLTDEELQYLKELNLFKDDFLIFLKTFQFTPEKDVSILFNLETGELEIPIKGSWLRTILYEVPILSLVNQIYYEGKVSQIEQNESIISIISKLEQYKNIPFPFAEFGTRRRFSKNYQKQVLDAILFYEKEDNVKQLLGTSNVMFAKEFNLKPIGTMAHEFVCAGQGLFPLRDSQKAMLEIWAKEYRGKLGIALSDTLGTDAFLRDFDLYLAKLYDGLRQDSGDPIVWGNKVLNHYRDLGVDAKTKSLVFSDGLDFEKANKIYFIFKERMNVSFGIGTYLTNNIPNITPLNVVMKMTKCNGQEVVKISDSPGKTIAKSKNFINWVKEVFEIE